MKYVVVTGACGGMGNAAVRLLADSGYYVIALDKSVRAAEERVLPIVADITDEAALLTALEIIRSATDELFAIVHFAGMYMLDSLIEISNDAFSRAIDINLRGAYLVNKTLFPLLHTGSRVIITTSELAPIAPLPFTGLYAVTKCALDRYAFSLGMELQLLGISVSVIRAGAVKTGMLGVSTDALNSFCKNTNLYSCNAERFRKIVGGVEAKHVQPEKIARKILKIIRTEKPGFAYTVNRNPLLMLYGALPQRMQYFAVKSILKKRNNDN